MDERGRRPWFHDAPPAESGLGEAIRRRRAELDMSRKDLAARAGLSYPYVSELETGKKRGSPSSLHLLAQALGVTQAELWTRAEAVAADSPGAGATSDMRLPRAARSAPPPPPPPDARDLAARVRGALVGADPADAEAALLMALGELRYDARARAPRDPGGRR